MGFFSNLFGMRSGARQASAVETKRAAGVAEEIRAGDDRPTSAADMLNALSAEGADTADVPGGPAIWDAFEPAADAAAPRSRRNKTRMIGFDAPSASGVGLFDDGEAAEDFADPDADCANARRNKTRMIGFETSAGAMVGLFEPEEEPEQPSAFAVDPNLPVGWLVVTSGQERGRSITLLAGTSDIGTGPAHTVTLAMSTPSPNPLSFGSLKHDPDGDVYTLAPAGRRPVLSLNGVPVAEEVRLRSGDTIGAGEVELRFVALCTDGFDWNAAPKWEEFAHATSP